MHHFLQTIFIYFVLASLWMTTKNLTMLSPIIFMILGIWYLDRNMFMIYVWFSMEILVFEEGYSSTSVLKSGSLFSEISYFRRPCNASHKCNKITIFTAIHSTIFFIIRTYNIVIVIYLYRLKISLERTGLLSVKEITGLICSIIHTFSIYFLLYKNIILPIYWKRCQGITEIYLGKI